MTHRATEQDLRASLEALREEIHGSLCSSVGELISALQGREIQAARQSQPGFTTTSTSVSGIEQATISPKS